MQCAETGSEENRYERCESFDSIAHCYQLTRGSKNRLIGNRDAKLTRVYNKSTSFYRCRWPTKGTSNC